MDKKGWTDHEIVKGVSEDLCPPEGNGWIAILERPSPETYFEMIVDGMRDARTREDIMKHGKAINEGTSAKAKGVHETDSKDGSITGVAEAKDLLQCGDQLETEGARKDSLSDGAHFKLIKGSYEVGDGMS